MHSQKNIKLKHTNVRTLHTHTHTLTHTHKPALSVCVIVCEIHSVDPKSGQNDNNIWNKP